MKTLIMILSLVSTFALAQHHEEFGKNNSFYVLVEATNNERVQRVIWASLENFNELKFEGITMNDMQPKCLGLYSLVLNYSSNTQKCQQLLSVGQCGELGNIKLNNASEMACQ